MNKIRFYGKYATLIKKGQKTQTIRIWRKCLLNINDNIIIDCKDQQFNAIITNIEYKNITLLTENDAVRDGFKTLIELQNTIKKIYSFYAPVNNETNVYIISFKLLS